MNKVDCFNMGAKAFFSGVFRGNCQFKGWQLDHWRKGWDSAHDGETKPEKKPE